MDNIKYEWIFSTPKVLISEDGLDNIVKSVNWTLVAKLNDETLDKKNYIAIYDTTTNFSNIEPKQFVPFDELTKQQVISWIESVEDIDQVKEWLASQIDEQMNPKTALIDFKF